MPYGIGSSDGNRTRMMFPSRDFRTTIAFTTCLCLQFVVWNQSSPTVIDVGVGHVYSLHTHFRDWYGITIGRGFTV